MIVVVFTLPGLFALFLSLVLAVPFGYMTSQYGPYELLAHFCFLAFFTLSGAWLSRRGVPTSMFWIPNWVWGAGIALLFLSGALKRGEYTDWRTISTFVIAALAFLIRFAPGAAPLRQADAAPADEAS